jgi:thiamine biosynthesis lipoprotein
MHFEAIGTAWQIDTPAPVPGPLEAAIMARIDTFDRTYSRFRDDSLVARVASTSGRHEFPDDAAPLFDTYRRLYGATGGAMSPLVGRSLDTLGYDRHYSLRPSGSAIAAPRWDDAVAWDGRALSTVRPVSVDVGAAGKGYLVDIVGGMLAAAGIPEFTIDASGDILHSGAPIRVGLEHPLDPTKAIGVASVTGAICASAANRRAWGDGLHHIVDATTGVPTTRVIATWAIAATALEADGLATALFFAEPAALTEVFEFSYVRMLSTGRVEFSPHLDGEMFT